MPLPHQLLSAISDPGGGKVALILGAGCSIEHPTSLPSSAQCSASVHQRLVSNEILAAGECNDPADLSAVADTVFGKTDSQKAVVDAIRAEYDLKYAKANEGYLVAAAMLAEGALSAVITLNFDLALSDAIADLTLGSQIGVVERPADIPQQKIVNVYYLHRNANEPDVESWVLRTAPLQTDWEGTWKQVIATRVLVTPVVVFAGLGTPVTVLIASAKLIKAAIPAGTILFQVDPGPKEQSKYYQELDLQPEFYIQYGWVAFMEALSKRLLIEHLNALRAVLTAKVNVEGVEAEDVSGPLARLETMGLVQCGKIRAQWMLDRRIYRRVDPDSTALVADLLLGLAMIGRLTGSTFMIHDDGIVEYHRQGRLAGAFLVASGKGHISRSAIEPDLAMRLGVQRSRATLPTGAIVCGVLPSPPTTLPEDLVRGEGTDDLIDGPAKLSIFDISDLRGNHEQVQRVLS